jgi:lysophospholipase
MTTTEGYLTALDSTRLHYATWGDDCAAEDAPVAILIHGFGEHLLRYEHVAQALVAGGLVVVAIDVRGHGKSDGQRGHVLRFDEYMVDVDAAFALAERVHPGGPRVLLGHSHGGLLAARYVLQESGHQPKVLILSSPFLGIAVKVPSWKAALGRSLSRFKPTFSLPLDLDGSLLSTDSAVGEAYAKDPLVHGAASTRWFTEVQGAQADALRRAHQIKLPTLIMQGGADAIVDVAATRRMAQGLGAEDKKYIEYDGLRHEIFNEVKKAEVLADMESWLNGQGLWRAAAEG